MILNPVHTYTDIKISTEEWIQRFPLRLRRQDICLYQFTDLGEDLEAVALWLAIEDGGTWRHGPMVHSTDLPNDMDKAFSYVTFLDSQGQDQYVLISMGEGFDGDWVLRECRPTALEAGLFNQSVEWTVTTESGERFLHRRTYTSRDFMKSFPVMGGLFITGDQLHYASQSGGVRLCVRGRLP